MSYSDHLDFYTRGPYSHYMVESRSAGHTPIKMFRARQPAGHYPDPPHPDLTLMLVNTDSGVTTRDYGAGRWQDRLQPGGLDLVPPNIETFVECEGDHAFTCFVLPLAQIAEALSEELPDFKGDFGHLHARPFQNRQVEQLCWRLWCESENGNPHGSLFADAAQLMLVSELIRAAQPRRSPGKRKIAPLSTGTMARIDEWIDDTIDQQVSTQELAALANMPQTAFYRAFKLTTGQSPYQYVIERRVTHARALLADNRRSLADIAFDCGFSSQQHMSSLFSSRVGITPAKYRAEVTE